MRHGPTLSACYLHVSRCAYSARVWVYSTRVRISTTRISSAQAHISAHQAFGIPPATIMAALTPHELRLTAICRVATSRAVACRVVFVTQAGDFKPRAQTAAQA
eukprot:scaffold18210_cov74-Phaeocystis_antarctica.AAC.2